jgi:hypothetical protein
MAFFDPGAVSNGAVIATTWGNNVRSSLLATGVNQVTTEGDIVIATGSKAVTRLAIGSQHDVLVAGSARPRWQIQPVVSVYISSAFDPTVSSWDDIEFDAEDLDTNAMHDTSTNTERLTFVANGDGIYRVGANVEFDSDGISSNELIFGVRILLNGTTEIGKFHNPTYRVAGHDLMLPLACRPYDFAAGDYITCQVYVDQDINIATAYFWAEFVRPN